MNEDRTKEWALLGMLMSIPILIIYDAFSWGYALFRCCDWFLPVIGFRDGITLKGAVALILLIRVAKGNGTNTGNLTVGDWEIKVKPNWPTTLGLPWMILLVCWGFHFIL